MRPTRTIGFVLGCLILSTACGDDDDDDTPPRIDAGTIDGGDAPIDAGDGVDAAPPTAVRGQYLVTAVLACNDCHTPRLKNGMPDLDNFLAGIDCFVDIDPKSDEAGCLASRNLTHHPTGLMNRTDDEIKDMLAKGERPDGTVLHSFMPYYVFAHLTPEDLDSVVLYLRTVPGVDHEVAASQPPWDQRPAEPAPPLGDDEIPEPTTVNDATRRGQYLAALACLECHTPRTVEGDSRSLDKTKLFAGGEGFPRDLLGLPPLKGIPDVIHSRNLTPHEETGIGYTKAQILTALEEAKDKEGNGICPPMPAGMAAFAHLTEADASDIADYILALPPIENEIPNQCVFNPGGP